jgi:uncharacterized protein (TIGR02757 family)
MRTATPTVVRARAAGARRPDFVALKATVERVRSRCDVAARLARDPVSYLHRYSDPLDQELVGILASSIAFGNVKTITQKLEDALVRLGPRPSQTADDSLRVFAAMHGWVHRVFRGEDLARLLIGARRVQRAHGTLGDRFAADLAAAGSLRGALAQFAGAIRDAAGLLTSPGAASRRGPAHLLPDPHGTSGSKRLLLYLRWMVRPADGVDLGLWPIPPSLLLCPVDTHIHKLSRNLGLTSRKDLSWTTAEEITAGLARLDPSDPVKYDFPLCHLGMLQRCPSRKDAARCEGCGVKPVCRHWQTPRRGAVHLLPPQALTKRSTKKVSASAVRR